MTTEKILTKDAILGVTDYQVQEVEVPEWGGKVLMRTLSGKGRDEFESNVTSKTQGNKVDVRGLKALLLSLVIVDEAGEPLFTQKDLDALNNKSSEVITRLFEVASKMNGIGEEAVEQAEKNSESGLNESTGSGSQDRSGGAQ